MHCSIHSKMVCALEQVIPNAKMTMELRNLKQLVDMKYNKHGGDLAMLVSLANAIYSMFRYRNNMMKLKPSQ